MKKSWVPVVACLAFIVLWQVFIVNPYNSKHRPLTKPITAPVTTPADSGEQAKGTLSTVPGATPVMTAMDDAQAVSIDIGPKRQVKVFPDFSLGSVVFWDYFVRGSKEKQAMVELKEGLHWTSTDPQVESCLLALRQGVVDPKNLVRESSVAAGKCKVTLAPDAAKAGLTHLSLQLSGFKGAQGFVELKGTDMVGAGPVQDHNYFGYRMDESRHWVKDKSLLEVTRKEGKVDWVTWGDKYFVTAFLPRGEYNPNVVYGPIPPTDGKDKHVYFGIQYPLFAKTEAN
ncbi:MAG: hypothetical protein JST16_18605, partial [Bdellovibrionales bacterium]|nr:hypothetical protein [Bdellovibrionales bacterium]